MPKTATADLLTLKVMHDNCEGYGVDCTVMAPIKTEAQQPLHSPLSHLQHTLPMP